MNCRPALSLCLAAAVLILPGCASLFLPDFSPRSDIDTMKLQRVLDAHPDNHHAEYMIGRAALESGEPRRAERHFRRAVAIQESFEEAHHGLGLALLERGRARTALEHFTEMSTTFPESPLAAEGMAAAALLLGEYETAEHSAREALRLDPGSVRGHVVLGEITYGRGEYNAALVHWASALDGDPSLRSELQPLLDDLSAYLGKYGE